MSKVAFNLIDYAKQNNLKLLASAKLNDGCTAKLFVNDNRFDCFILDANRKIVGAKGAQGSESHLMDTALGVFEKLQGKIQELTTYIK